MIHDHDLIIVFGIRGSGKSTLTRELSERFSRRIVFDRLGEWEGFPTAIGLHDFHEKIQRFYHREFDDLVVRFPPGHAEDAIYADLNEMLRILWSAGKRSVEIGHDHSVALVFEELQFYSGPHFSPPFFNECLFTGRHAGLAIIGNTQRPASISKAFVSQASHLFCGQLHEPRDLEYLKGTTLGKTAFDLPKLKKGEFLWARPGEETLKVKVF